MRLIACMFNYLIFLRRHREDSGVESNVKLRKFVDNFRSR
jgi:hypothetical protein